MAAIRLMRRWSIPLATAVAAPIFTPVVFADSDKKNVEADTSRMVRPSDLPIYETPQEVLNFEYHGKERTSLEENIGVVRKEVEGVISATRSTREKIVHICETGKAHTMATIDYITDEENVLPRAGAITVGGLTGLVIGRKGGFLKKVLYTSTGALTAASLCYPRHAYQASQKVLENAKDIGTIGYNFVAGVKPQNKVPSPPTEITKEEPAPAPAPEAVEAAAPVPTPTAELEGGEVRKVIPENVSVEDFLSPLDSVVQQSSDVTVWGFRLTDKPSENLSPKSDDGPSKPVVPEGFGTIAEVQHETEQIIEEEQESQTASISGQTEECQVVTEESVVEEDIKTEETPFESKEPETLPLVEEKGEDVGLEPESVPTMADMSVLTEPKFEIPSLEHESQVIEDKGKDQEKSGMTSVRDETERQEAHVLKDIGLNREENNVQKVGLVNKIIDFFSNDKQSEPIDKDESQIKEIVIEGGEKVEEKIAEVVLEVAEVVEKEMEEVIKEAEVVDDVSKKVESVLEVVEDVASAAAKAAHDTPEMPESVAEKAELTKVVAEKVEEIVGTVEFVVQEVENTAEEIKEKAEDIENKMVELIESKEKREELVEKAYDFVAGKVSELSSTEPKEAPEKSFEAQEIDNNATKGNRLEEIPSSSENKESELISSKDKIIESEEIMDKDKTPFAESESTESSEEIGIVNKVIQFFKSDKEESVKDTVDPINEREVVEDPISEAVSEEVKPGLDEESQPTEVIKDVSKDSESIVNVVEHGANEVTKIAEVIEDVCEKAESGIDVAEDIASAAAAAAHDTPGIPDFVGEKAEEAKDIAEEAKEVVSTVEYITEKVDSFVEHIKEEAEIFKDISEETDSSENKGELVEVTDHVANKSQDELQVEGKGLEVLHTKEESIPEVGKPVDVTHDERDQKPGVVDKILEFFSSNKEDSEVVKEVVEPVEEAVIEGGERIEKVAAEVVAEIAEDVVRDTTAISEVTEIVEDVSKKVESVADVVEDVSSVAAKGAEDIPGIPDYVKERAEETSEIAGEMKEVVGTIDVVSGKISDIIEEIKSEAENIENKATELIDNKEKREELIEKAFEYVTGKSLELTAADEVKQYDHTVTEESQLDVNTEKVLHKEEEVGEIEENTVKEASIVTDAQSMQKEKIGLVDKILHLFSNDESQDHVKETEKAIATEVAVIVGEKVEEKIAEAVRDVTEVVEKEMTDTVMGAQVVEEVTQKVESALEYIEDVAGAAAKAAHETPEIPESVVEKAELTKDIAEKVENVISTVEHVAEKIKETAEEIQKEAESIGEKASELIESKEKREELIETTIEYVTGKAKEESTEMPTADALEQTNEDELGVNTIETVNKEVVKPDKENESTEVSDLTNVIESIQKEETGLVNKILQFFTNNENQEPVNEIGKPLAEEVILEGGEKLEEKIAEAISDVADTEEKEMVEIVQEAQVETGLEVVENVASTAGKAVHENLEVRESVANDTKLTKDFVEKVEEVTGTVEYIAEKIEETAEEIKEEVENIGNIASELIESKEKREELLETAIEFVSGKVQEESAELLTADQGKQIRDEQNISINEAVNKEEIVEPEEIRPTGVSDVMNVNQSIKKEEPGLVDKILQFFTNDENQEPVKELEKTQPEGVVLEGGEKIEEKIAEAVTDVAEVTEKETVEVIQEAKVVEDQSQKVEDVAGAAAKVALETPTVHESVNETAELKKNIAEKVEEVTGTVEYIAEKIEKTVEEMKKGTENVESTAIELIESKEKREELLENVTDFVVDNTEEKLTSTEPTLMTNDTDVSKVEQLDEKGSEELKVVPRREKLLEKISSIFGKNNTKSEEPTGVVSDISRETDVSDSPTETVPEPVAGDGSSTEAATSVTGAAVADDSQVQSPSDVMGTVEGVGDTVSGVSTPEIGVPSVTSAVSEKDQDLVLEVKDKSLFEQLSDLVTSDVKQNISSTGSSTQTTDDSVHHLQEKTKSEDTNAVSPNKEVKPSLLSKITTIFTDRDPSKVTKQIPTESSDMVKDDMKSDVFIITAKPNHPVDVASEESAQQSKSSTSNVQPGWFRTGAAVKQEGKDVIVQLNPDSPPEKDYGQSNPEDADMYTTRS